MIYCNEINPYACAWLGNLMAAGVIPQGHVDGRSIEEVQPDDVRAYPQCHWFAGVGGWCHALTLAGWPATRPVWTASLPCQPFSVAGKQEAQADERHLWPVFFRLVRECRPVCLVGEQVPGAIGHGWLDGVFSDLETAGYTCGAVVLGAHSAGAPHQRQRLFWMAQSNCPRRAQTVRGQGLDERNISEPGCGELAGRIGSAWSDYLLIPCRDGKYRRISAQSGDEPLAHGIPTKRADPRLGYLLSRLERMGHSPGAARRVLAAARRNRIGRLSGYGNAIVPQTAAVFLRSVLEILE